MPRWDDDRDLEPEEPRPLPADWCPTCGESQAEHSKEQADRCFEGFLKDNELINKVIEESLQKRQPAPLPRTRFEREDPL